MTSFGYMLAAGAVANDVGVGSKKALLQHFALLAEQQYGLPQAIVAERLTDRERLGSTGFGKGVAIPHGKVEELDHIVALFVKLAQPVDFQAIDGLPVDLALCLLSPPDSGAEHLKALAKASRLLRDSGFVAKLRGAASNDALYALFEGQEERHAA